jgi:hypothetical protein
MLLIALALIFTSPATTLSRVPSPPFPALAAPAREPAVRDQIQAALDAMSKAVLAGDPKAYADCIAPRSPFFTVEQAEWAKDLLKPETRPVAFTATVTADGTVDGNGWFGPVRFAWTMPTTGEAKTSKEAAVEFDILMTHTGDGFWKYAGEAMDALDADPKAVRATIHYPKGAKTPPPAARQIAQAFPIAKAHVDEFFGQAIDRVEEIRLYDRRDVLQFSVYPSMFQTDTTLSGWSETGQSIKFLTNYARDEKGWTAAFAHEYGHVATWNLGDKAAAMPWWVQEGIAELAAETYTGGRARIDPIIVAWAKRDGLATWDELADYRKTPQDKRRHPYHQGHHMVGFIHDTFGREKCIAWITSMAKGSSVDQAAREVLAQPFADLDRAWREHVAALVAKSKAPAESEKK